MIKIGKSIKELDALAEIFYKEVVAKLGLSNLVQQRLDNATNNNLVAEIIFYREVKNHLKEIIVSKPSNLEILSTQLFPLYSALETFRVNAFATTKNKIANK